MLALRLQHELALTAGNSAIPLADLVNFEDGSFAVDAVMVRQMVDAAPLADPRHTPDDSQARGAQSGHPGHVCGLAKEYRKLPKAKPGNTENWYAKQIEKMPDAGSQLQHHQKNTCIPENSWAEKFRPTIHPTASALPRRIPQ
ncbi:MAG: hypothetical protein IPF55_15405 [Rhodoferax sp.]|nr:hypothetical protein [Rhodoferax sp.]